MSLEKEMILNNIEGNILLWKHGVLTTSATLDLISKNLNEPRGDYGDNIRYSQIKVKGNMSRLTKELNKEE